MQRMQPEQRRHQHASPERPGQAAQQQEDKNGVEGVQQEAGQVMAPGFQSEKLTVQHVGQHRYGVPIAGHGVAESPNYAFPTQPRRT